LTSQAVESQPRPDQHARVAGQREPLVILIGNPNVGKTSLFNGLSGQRARVGNYPGVTIERRETRLKLREGSATLVDVPGTYSLSARSSEEQIALSSVLGVAGDPAPDLVVVVVDAGQLTRNLYLVLQLIELRLPMLVAVNMLDEVEDKIPLDKLSEELGLVCVGTNARKGEGTKQLKEAIESALTAPVLPRRATPAYGAELLDLAVQLGAELPQTWLKWQVPVAAVDQDARRAALGMWALTSIEADDELEGVPQALRARCLELTAQHPELDIDLEIAQARYTYLDSIAERISGERDRHTPKRKLSERIDRVLLHPVFGFVAFISVMLLVFQSLFAWADPAIGAIESLIGWLQQLVTSSFADSVLRDLVTQGVIGGVGNVIVFLPQILLLFLFIGLLEDTGYMARVAYLMDRIMKSLGLHGRAFVPMLSGFACAVPAIMATRTMERQKDRLLTMLVIPLMTCSARLPVYTLIIGALFPPSRVFGFLPVQGLLMVFMYVFAMSMTLGAAAVLGRTTVKVRRIPLILELPPYRFPNLRSIARSMLERSMAFLKEAGTVILVCTIALWALLYFPRAGDAPPNVDAATHQAQALERSYGGRVGKAIEPAIEPLGFDWKIGVGLIGSFAAREVFVSTMALVYGVGETDDEALPLREKIRTETKQGKPAYTPLVGMSLLVFFALACQCMSTLAVVRRETNTWRWPVFMFGYMTVLAYVCSLLVYQAGRLLGFG